MDKVLGVLNSFITEFMTRIGNVDLLGFFDTPMEAMRSGMTLGVITFAALLICNKVANWFVRIITVTAALVAFGFYFGILG